MLNYRFRLYPTREQKPALEQTLDGCRWVYNYFIDKKMSEYDMNYASTELKEQHPWLRNYHSKMLQMVANITATGGTPGIYACGDSNGVEEAASHSPLGSGSSPRRVRVLQ